MIFDSFDEIEISLYNHEFSANVLGIFTGVVVITICIQISWLQFCGKVTQMNQIYSVTT